MLLQSTAGVTRWWVGRDNATLTEPTPSHESCLKTRRLPPVGCIIRVYFRDALLGAFCKTPFTPANFSQSTHKRTFPRNTIQTKNTMRLNLFSCQRDHQGLHIRHESPPLSARLALNRSGKESFLGGKFCYQSYFVMKLEN